MFLGDNTKIPEEWRLRQKKNVYFGLFIMSQHVECIGTVDPSGFVKTIVALTQPDSLPIGVIVEKHVGRPIKQIDCAKLCKWDAIGELFNVSKMDIERRPIVIIENITDIPEEDANHDNPKYVENLLLHGWKESSRNLTSPKHGDFTLVTSNYTVLIPWDLSKAEQMKKIWRASDGLAWLGNHEKALHEWMDTGFDESRDFLLKAGHIIALED